MFMACEYVTLDFISPQNLNINSFHLKTMHFMYNVHVHSALTLLTPPGKVCLEARKLRSSIEVCNPGWRHILKTLLKIQILMFTQVWRNWLVVVRRKSWHNLTPHARLFSSSLPWTPQPVSEKCQKLHQLDKYWGFVGVRLFSRKTNISCIYLLWLMFALHWESLDSQKVTFEAKCDAEKDFLMMAIGRIHSYICP